MTSEENDKLIYSFFKQKRNDSISQARVDEYETGTIDISYDMQKLVDEYMKSRYSDGVDCLYELLHRLKENIETRPTCQRCHSRVIFSNKHYHKFCSPSCSSLYHADSVRQKNKQRLDEIKADAERYAKYVDNRRKAGQRTAHLIKTDAEYKERYRKHATALNHKVWNSYDDVQRQKRCDAMSAGWKDKFDAMTNDELVAYKERCSERATAEWNKKTPAERKKIAEHQTQHWQTKTEQQRKDWWMAVIASKTVDGKPLFPSRESKQETEMYDTIRAAYPDAVRWYRDERYGFYECDIYVPSKDAFIECQFFKTHGGHPFDPNNADDIALVEQLKHNKFCHHDYKTFSVRDPHKRELAKENNLNFLELWNCTPTDKECALNWLSKLKNIKTEKL